MDLRFRIRDLESNLGDTIELDPAGVTCIVGPNNVGKSKMLREVYELLTDQPNEAPVVLAAANLREHPIESFDDETVTEFRREANQPTGHPRLASWLRANSGGYGPDHRGRVMYSPKGFDAKVDEGEFIRGILKRRLRTSVAPFFINNTSVSTSALSGTFHDMDGEGELSGNYMALIHRSKNDVEDKLSEVFYGLFGQRLVYDQATGFNGLRLGAVDRSLLSDGRPTTAYTNAMRELPKLAAQGSGMQAILGPIAALTIGSAQVVLMDEPETYLHPPQARALGQIVGRESVASDKQTIVVTHDRDFVVGLMESGAPLRFIRIAREGDGNRLSEVRTSDVERIWSRAVLRYSNLLSGLFYRRVIVCESDGDCRFYGAILDDLLASSEVPRHMNETLYIPSGGKSGMAMRIRALAQLHVETSVIIDFDIFSDPPSRLEGIVEGLGNSWSSQDREEFNTVKSALTVAENLKSAKTNGLAALPAGKSYATATQLLQRLNERGVFVVPVGELESFDKAIGRQKEGWVEDALEKKLHQQDGEHRILVKNAALGRARSREG